MKYLPTIDLWQSGIQEAILCGQLRLQPGQWVSCGSTKPSRFVKSTTTSIWAAHPQGTPKESFQRFMSLLEVAKKR